MGHSSCDKLACAYFTCWWWQGCQEQQKRTNFNILALFKSLPVSHLLMPHWPKRVTWPSPDSRNGEIDHLEKASAKSDCMCWLQMHTQMVRICGHSKSCPSICTILPSYQLMRGLPLVSTNTCSPFHISLSAEWVVAFYCALFSFSW